MRSSPPRQRAGSQAHAPDGPPSGGPGWRALWPSLAIIVILSLVGYGHLLTPGKLPYSRYSDFVAYHLSAKTVLYDSLRQGRGIPFWRSDQLSGSVALTNPQAAYTCPLHFLFALLPPVAALGPTDYLHFLAAGGVFYALGAVLGLGRWPRVFLAAAGMFNFKLLMAVFAGWLGVIPTIVWTPALLAAVIYVVRRPGPAGATAVAVTGALCLHAGQVQLVYYLAWFLVGYGLIELGRLARRRQGRALARAVLWSGSGAVLAAGLSAILLLPLAADGRLCSRAAASLEFFLRPMSPRCLLTFLDPEALGTPLTNTYKARELWEDVAYFGIVPLALAAVAVVRGWRRRPVVFLAVSLLICTVVAFDTTLLRLAYEHLPGFKLFRIPGRLLFVGSIFGLALAGIGLEELLAALGRKGAAGRRWAGAIVAAAIVIVTVEGTYRARCYLTMAPYAEALPQAQYRDFFAADRSLYRVASLERSTINAGWAAPMGVQLVTGFDAYNYAHYFVYFHLMATGQVVPARAKVWFELDIPSRLDLLDALNVKYVVARGPLDVVGTPLEPAAVLSDQPMFWLYLGIRHDTMFIYRNTRCLDRASWAGTLTMATSQADMVEQVSRSDLHAQTVLLGAAEGVIVNQPSPGDGMTMTSWAPGRVTLRTHTGAQRFLVVSEVWNPAWRVRIDGRTAEKFQTNISLIGLAVPAGDHDVTLEFVPPHWSAACGITIASAAAAVLLGVLAIVGRMRARRAPQRDQPGGDSISRR